MTDWDEDSHPRDDEGKFSSGSGAPPLTQGDRLRKWAESRARLKYTTKPLYHVTYQNKLEGIANHGIRPARHGEHTMSPNEAHKTVSRKRSFLSDSEGVGFWHSRAEEHADSRSDDPKGEGLTPVVLRITKARRSRLMHDPMGSDDARSKAYRVGGRIHPKKIEVFHGGKWHPVAHHAKLDFKDSYDVDEDGTAWLKQHYEDDDAGNPHYPGKKHR